MSIAIAVKHMLAAGMSAEQIVDAVAEMEATALPRRSAGAVRQERYRRNKASQSVTSDESDAVPSPLAPPLEGFPEPLPKAPPLIPPSSGSLCSPAVALPLFAADQEPAKPEPEKPKAAYPKDFEFLWSEWPKNPNESKKTAFERWKRLSSEEKLDCLDGVFAQSLWLDAETERRKGRDPPPRIHLSTFISEKRWEALLKTEFNKYGRNPWQTQPQH